MSARHSCIREIESLVKGELDPVEGAIVREHIIACDRCGDLFTGVFGLKLDRFEPAEALSVPNEECPDPQRLQAYAAGYLTDKRRAAVHTHVESCSLCRYILSYVQSISDEGAALADTAAGAPQPAVGFIKRGAAVKAISAGLLRIPDSFVVLLRSMMRFADYFVTARLLNVSAIRRWKAGRLARGLTGRWEALGRRLQRAMAGDASAVGLDEAVLKLEAGIARDLPSMSRLQASTRSSAEIHQHIREIKRFVRRYMEKCTAGDLTSGEAASMALEWNSCYWCLNELARSSELMPPKQPGRSNGYALKRLPNRDCLRRLLVSVVNDGDTRGIFAGTSALLLFLAALGSGNGQKPSFAEQLWSGLGDGILAFGDALAWFVGQVSASPIVASLFIVLVLAALGLLTVSVLAPADELR